MRLPPIHEIVECRNKWVKVFYWQLWFTDDEEPQDLEVCDTFTGPEVTISASDVEAFCTVVGDHFNKIMTVGWDESMYAFSPTWA